jgi:vacuolar iron transporter family protein
MATAANETDISDTLAARATQVQRGGARAAVLGVNDGLVSTLCIVVGVAAAGSSHHAVLLAGFAGLLAGAISMAAGEWISVKSQVELFEGVLADLKDAVKENPKLLSHNLAHTFAKYGMRHDSAHDAANDIARHGKGFIKIYSAQVIGLNPDELGSPWRAALSSFALFTVGSLAPLTPWLIGWNGTNAIVLAIILTSFGGLFVGGYTARSSGKSILYGGVRQLLIIAFAAIVTYGIGHLFGVAVS